MTDNFPKFKENNKPTDERSISNIYKNTHKENSIKKQNINNQIAENQWKRETLVSSHRNKTHSTQGSRGNTTH